MAAIDLLYRLTLYAPKGEDPTETTVLTPRSGAAHAESFILSTRQGVGTRAYLDTPRGRHGQIDPLTKQLSTGTMSVRVFDARVTAGGDNDERWVTAFIGDAGGKHRLLGCKATLEESTDGGSSWTGYFTGRVFDVDLDTPLWFSLSIRDLAEDLNRPVFVGAPHRSLAADAFPAAVLPIGLPQDWGNFKAVPAITATVTTIASRTVDGKVRDRAGLWSTKNVDVSKLVPPPVLAGNAELMRSVRARVTYNGQSGVFAIDTSEGIGGKGIVAKTVKASLPGVSVTWTGWIAYFVETIPGHPEYMAMPPNGASVTVSLFVDGPPTEAFPLLVDDVHPVQLWADLLDGKYSRLSGPGQPRPVAARDTAAFDRLIADDSFGTVRLLIDQEWKCNEFIEKTICQPFDLAYRLDGSGRVVPLDLRRSAHTVPDAVLTDDALVAGEEPRWGVTRQGAVTGAVYTYYVDTPVTRDQFFSGQDAYNHVTLVRPYKASLFIENDLSTLKDVGEKLLKLDAKGTRFHSGEVDVTTGAVQSDLLRRRVEGRTRDAMEPYATGVVTLRLPCRRGSDADDVQPGMWCAVTVSKQPDPATVTRGGTRLMLCTARSEQGLRIDLDFLDAGAAGIAVPPSVTIAAASGTSNAIDATITRNADGDDVRLEYAITTTSTTTAPDERDQGWVFGAVATGTVQRLDNLPRGARIWVRGRSQPRGTGLKLPSVWVQASPAYIDLSPIGSPSGVTASNLFANRVDLSWTVGVTSDAVEVYLHEGSVPSAWSVDDLTFSLGPGSTRIRVTGLTASTTYGVGVRHRDKDGGFSAMATATFTTTATAGTAPRPAALDIIFRPSA